MAEAEHALSQAAVGAKDALVKVLNVVFDWVVPIIVLLVGFYVGGAIGLSGAIYGLLDGILPNSITQTALTWVSDLVAIGIYLAIGAGIWHAAGGGMGVGEHMNVRKWILRPIAMFFSGCGAAEAANLVSGRYSTGKLSAAASQMAAGGK